MFNYWSVKIKIDIIKLQNLDITMEDYIFYLKSILGNHVIGQLFDFVDQPFSTKIYLLLSMNITNKIF